MTGGATNTFPANIPVQPGDVLGIQDVNANIANSACIFDAPGDADLRLAGDLGDGESGDFSLDSDPGFRLNISAQVAFQPSNDFSFGKVKRNKNKGTATIAVDVPGSGTLALSGKGIKAQRSGGGGEAVASKTVTGAGTAKLLIKAKAKAKKKLNETGKVKVKAKVTYTPNGDIVGEPNTETKLIKLIKQG